MKRILICGLVLVAATGHAQELANKSEPLVELDKQGMPLTIRPEDRHEILEEYHRVQSILIPVVCADLTAKPVPLPNGDMQFPVIPCTKLDVSTPPVMDEPQVAPPVAAPPAPRGTPVPPTTPTAGAQPTDDMGMGDMNGLQMRRLGELDAMQGRPLNMGYASNLGYIQGYTAGQERRLRMPAGGGFGGFNR